MKALDFLLLAVAVGLSVFNFSLFSSDYPANLLPPPKTDSLERDAPPNPTFRHIVLHDFPSSHHADGFPFHLLIGDGSAYEEGTVVFTERWRRQEGRGTIDIALLGPLTSTKQDALLRTIRRLCDAYSIRRREVGAHGEIPDSPACGIRIDGTKLRRILADQPSFDRRTSS